MSDGYQVLPVRGLPEVRQGDDLGRLLYDALRAGGAGLHDGDVLVVAQKAVSKAEGRVVDLGTIEPSALAREWAERWQKDPRQVEVVLGEAARIVRMDRGVLIVETREGWVCANAGVDASNAPGSDRVTLLPVDSDASAAHLRARLRELSGADLAVIVSDTFGRPWREALANVAIGVAGMDPILDYTGRRDANDYELKVTAIAVADELAGAAELVMGKLERVPAALIRGYRVPPGDAGARKLVRPGERDLFR